MLAAILTFSLSVLSQSDAPDLNSETAYDLRCAATLTRQIRELRDFSAAERREQHVQALTFYYGRLSETAPAVTSAQIEQVAAAYDDSAADAEFCQQQYAAFLDRLLRQTRYGS